MLLLHLYFGLNVPCKWLSHLGSFSTPRAVRSDQNGAFRETNRRCRSCCLLRPGCCGPSQRPGMAFSEGFKQVLVTICPQDVFLPSSYNYPICWNQDMLRHHGACFSTGQREVGWSSDLKSRGGFSPKPGIYGFGNWSASSHRTAEGPIGHLDVWHPWTLRGSEAVLPSPGGVLSGLFAHGYLNNYSN